MNKIIYPDAHEELVRAAAANGEAMATLIDTERGVKSASSALIGRDILEAHRPREKDVALMHLIAMGDSNTYSYNKNGDWFSGDVLEKRAHTFVTNGHVFTEHRNRDPKYKTGDVKYASYDGKGMRRVELLIHLDGKLDPEGFQMAKEGKALNFSMSCRVPNDRCSCCQNKAKTVASYCNCLKTKMGQWMPSFQKYAFAYNDEPTFFDISKVKNPADRIARHLEYMFANSGSDMSKCASFVKYASEEDIMIPSAFAAMAEGVNLDTFSLEEQSVITKLASAENFVKSANHNSFYTDSRVNSALGSYPFALMEPLSAQELDKYINVRPETLFREFSKRACVMSFPAFCQYISQDVNAPETGVVKKAALMLPGMFGNMACQLMTMRPMTSMFQAGSEFSADMDPKRTDFVQSCMQKAEQKFSVESEPVKQRVVHLIIKSSSVDRVEEFQKVANAAEHVDPVAAEHLASAYCQYQVRAICDIQEHCKSAAVTDQTYDIIAAANSVLVFAV